MPDWLIQVLVALIGGLTGAGGLATYLRMRSDARAAREAHQDDHILKLISAQDASEVQFRDAVIKAYEYEVAARRDLDSRLTVTQKDLTVAIAERDLSNRQLERAQAELVIANAKISHLEADLLAASERIRHLEAELAALQAQQKEQSV